MLQDLLLISLTVSAVILLFLPLRSLLRRRYPVARLYVVWLILALRLIIPFRWEWENAPVRVPAPPMADTVVSPRPAPAAPAEPLPEKSLSLSALLPRIWALGAGGLMVYHLGAYFLFRIRIRPYLIPVEEGSRKSFFVKEPAVYRCPAVKGPMMLGYFRPVILLPETDYTQEEQMAVLLHERAHFRRGDMWYKLLLLLANAVHWFNPLVWWMVKKAEEDLEFACDELVVYRQGLEFRKHYSSAILKTVEQSEE